MVKDRRRRCQSISRVVWPLSFTLWGIRYVSFSHEASHHGAASIRPLLCQVLSTLLCFCMLVCIILPLFSSLPVSLSAYPSSAQPAASHLPIYSCGFAALQCLTATPCNPADLSFAGLFLFLKHDRHSLLHLFVLTLSQKSWSKTTSKTKQDNSKKKTGLKKKHRSIRLLTV